MLKKQIDRTLSLGNLKNILAVLLTLGTLQAQAVVNGVAENANQHPEVALLILSKEKLPPNKLFISSLAEYGICSGAFVSDRIAISAGHCLENEGAELFPYLATATGNGYVLTAPIATATDYAYEDLEGVTEEKVCSPGPKPLPVTKTPDISVLLFPAQTASKWFTISVTYSPKENDSVRYFGYGTNDNPFSGVGGFLIKEPTLRSGSSEVWRTSAQRIGFVNEVSKPFAADGDSGGPVIVGDKLVGVMSTISERCKTQFGEDYAILNTSSLFSNEQAKAFLKKAIHKLNGL